MRELPRLIHDGADDFELSLLRSTELDVGSSRALEKTLVAVGVAGAVASSTSLATAASSPQAAAAGVGAAVSKQSVGAALAMKWFGAGVAGVAAIGGIWFSTQRQPEQVAPAPANVEVATIQANSNVAEPSVTHATPQQPVETVAVEELGNMPVADEAGKAELGNDAARSAKKRSSAASLSDEIKAVSEIRENLSSPASALQAINRYQQRFPRGRLQQEVTVLKIMALQRSGQSAQARNLGERFLAAHPTSAHAKRVRSLLGL